MNRWAVAAAAAITTLAATSPVRAAPPKAPTYRFAQPAQPLADALIAVSVRSGAAIIAPAARTSGLQAPALRGDLTLEEALRRLLARTDLTFSLSANGVVTIRPRPLEAARPPLAPPPSPPAPAAPEGPIHLDAVTIVAQPLGEPSQALERTSASQANLLIEEDLQRAGSTDLGELVARLPGASATFDGGEARQVAIRGVGGRFTRVRINGMETLATFGAANAGGGTNRGRAFDYNVFAAGLFRQVRLQKTASADLDEGSLGASVDMRTRSPMNRGRRNAAFVIEQGYNSSSDRILPRASVVLSARDPARRFGVLVSAAYSRRSLVETGTTAGQWETGTAIYPGFAGTTTALPLSQLNSALHARIPRLERMAIDQDRLGMTATLEWRPDDRTQVSADLLYAEVNSRRREDLLESFTFRTAGVCASPAEPDCGINGVTVTDARIKLQGGRVPVLIAGRFDGVDLRSETRRDVLGTIFRQGTLAATRRFDNGVKASLLVGFSRSDFSNPVQDTLHLQQDGVSGFAYDFADARRPKLHFGDANLGDPAAWRLVEFRSDPNWVDNSFKSAGLDLEGAAGPLAWRAGVLHKRYRASAQTLTRSDGGIANINSDLPAAVLATPVADYAKLVGQGDPFGIDNPPAAWLAIDFQAAERAFARACAPRACDMDRHGLATGPNYDITETADAVYAQIARPYDPDRRIWGEAGVRLVRTRTDIESLGVDAQAQRILTYADREDWQTLPSANLAWSLGHAMVMRFGAARVIARPELMTLRPGVSISTAGGAKYLASGAPDLKPTLARAFDLSLEWTPRPGAVVSVAAYHKAISTTVQLTITRPQAFADNPFGLPASVAAIACGSNPGCSPDLPIWQFARPANSGPGHLNGVEAAFRAPLGGGGGEADWIVEGALAYTRTSVRMYNKFLALEDMEDALGAPRVAGNLGLTYRRPWLELRASVNHRGDYLATIPAPNGGDVDGVDAVTTVDASARVTLNDHFRLTLDAANLTNAIQRQFSDRTHIPNYQHRTGREVRIGLRADF